MRTCFSVNAMRTLPLLLALLIPLAALGQSNVLTGTVANYGLVPQSGVAVKLTLVSPNPRVVDGVMVLRDPVSTTSSTNGTFAFTNVIWGKYTLSVGLQPTTWTVNVGTNTTGTVPIGSLASSTTPAPPNPATNYYTQSQIDAIVASIAVGAGGLTNGQENVGFNAISLTNATLWGSGDAEGTRLWYSDELNTYAGGTWYFQGGVNFSGAEVSGFPAITNWQSGATLPELTVSGSTNTLSAATVNADTLGSNGEPVITAAVAIAGTFIGDGSSITNLNLTVTTNNLFAWTSSESYQPTNIVVDANGVIQTAGVLWPDGYGGLLTNTATNATWLTVDAFTITHAGTGWTVVQAAVSRGPLGVVTNKPALTIQ